MPEYVFFVGNHPDLSYMELKAVLGTRCEVGTPLSPLPLCVAKCEELIPEEVFDRLGGVERVGVVLGQQDTPWSAPDVTAALSPLPRKLWLGLGSLNGKYDLDSLAFEVKTKAQEAGAKLKFVLPLDSARGKPKVLNAAQVIFNKLDRSPNLELTFFESDGQHYGVKTIWIQDIRSYEVRDTSRPARFGKVGILPPKLAQIMINLAMGDSIAGRVLDPFCGMGTILQEAQLMGYAALGLDISPDMVRASKKNLAHLSEHFSVSEDPVPQVVEYDARRQIPREMGVFDAVVTEPDMGPALRGVLPYQEVGKRHQELGQKYQQVFASFARALKSGAKVVFLMPAFAQQRGQDFVFMPERVLDGIAKIGYRRVHPLGEGKRLFYARPDAWVGREITIWQRL